VNLVTGRRTSLRPLAPDDIPWVTDCAENESLYTWRLRGASPSPDSFEAWLWRSAEAQFIAVQTDTDDRLGFLQIHAVDLQSGSAQLSVLMSARTWRRGWPLEAVILAMWWAFEQLPIERLYAHVSSAVLERIASVVDSLASVSAVLEGTQAVGPGATVHVLTFERSAVGTDTLGQLVDAHWSPWRSASV